MPVRVLSDWIMGHLMAFGSASTNSPYLGREGQEGMGPCKLPDGVYLSVL